MGKHGLRNYLVHIVDGGLYMGGVAFVAPESVLPRVVEGLGGPAWIISLMPVALPLGFVLPGVLFAHRVERLERTLPAILLVGIIQRLPFLFAGLTLLLAGDALPGLALAAVVLAPLVSGVAGGTMAPAWMELVAKTVPANRRASAMAIRMILASIIGMISGGAIATVLHRWPGMTGFGILHLVAFGFMVLSISILAMVREEAAHPGHHGPAMGLRENLRGIPALLRGSAGLSPFVLARVLTSGFFIVLPFMAIHALESSGHPDSYLGILVSVQMGGAILGNLASGIIGDRMGARGPSLLGTGLLAVLCIMVPYSQQWSLHVAGFGLLGFGMSALRVGMVTLALELAPVSKRATVIAAIGWFMGIGLLGNSILGGILWAMTGNLRILGGVSAALMVLAWLVLYRVPEPRGAGPGAESSPRPE